ncbi:MAG: glutamine synthetase [Firmicutes bacterium]|nr:glutamine synthetase [Bacillota bacterium]
MNDPFKCFSNDNLLYLVPPELRNPQGLEKVLIENPQIKFVSLVGVDLGGNDTDEKIPVSSFLKNVEEFLSGGIQTDGSSVVLPKIATLNNGKVDFIADPSVNWFVDYNYEHLDPKTGIPLGTLRIPSFLIHAGHKVDSRSILAQTLNRVKEELLELFKANPGRLSDMGIDVSEIEAILFTAATELEFWVRTPGAKIETEKLTTSQTLHEQYWKRTKGAVRTALENSLILLEKYGLNPEMGHKEVGGVKATIGGDGHFNDIMEQLEIDWKYADPLQTADNEILARIVIKEVFRLHGLEAIFNAKPIEGVAGSGEHTHLSIAVKLKNGMVKNLFTPADPQKNYLSPLGWGALMGILKNYETIGAFISASNDAFNRLKPGFEAPVCIVASIGHNLNTPSRNRTVLAGLIRDLKNPLATRFEIRSPNPHTNTYLALAALYSGAIDGIKYALKSNKSAAELEREFSKKPGEAAAYLEKERCYRSEENVFEAFDAEERDRLFGKPPATVWEALRNLDRYPEKTQVLTNLGVLDSKIIESYREAMLILWITELRDRIIPENTALVRSFVKRNDDWNGTDYDETKWAEIQQLRIELLQDRHGQLSLFSRIRAAIKDRDYQLVSDLQLEMAAKMELLKVKYHEYIRNLLE